MKLINTGHDFQKVGIIKDGLFNPLTAAQITTLAGTLGAGNKGLGVYDTDNFVFKVWTGAAFAANPVAQSGLTPKGGSTFNATEPGSPVTGDLYIFTTAGTNTWGGGSNVVQINDQVFWDGAAWEFLQGNSVQGSTSIQGLVQLATDAEAITGTDTAKAVTAANVAAREASRKVARVYFVGSLTLVADTPLTVTHSLGLQNRDAFVADVKVSNSSIEVDIDSIDVNSLSITSSVAASSVNITVIGF